MDAKILIKFEGAFCADGGSSLGVVMQVVFVDDEVELHELFEFMFDRRFKKLGWQRKCFKSPNECLEYFANDFDEQAPPNSLIVTDINMPGMSGLDMISELNLISSDWNFWVLSAFESEEYKERAISLGVKEVFQKPVNFSDMLDKMSELYT